ncbi:hypothetical protein JW872_03410 [Candidatus Babeliales bacterium]|nr:hypothetical protein [Candidatus Babeliales bacterium]
MNESLTHFLERALAYQHNPENLEMGDELLVDGANLNCIRLAQLEYCLKRFDKGIEHVWSVPNDRKGDFLEFIRHEIKRPDIAEYYLQVYMSPKHATR